MFPESTRQLNIACAKDIIRTAVESQDITLEAWPMDVMMQRQSHHLTPDLYIELLPTNRLLRSPKLPKAKKRVNKLIKDLGLIIMNRHAIQTTNKQYRIEAAFGQHNI